MPIHTYTRFDQLDDTFPAKLETFVHRHPHGNFFQSPGFFQFLESVEDHRPFQLIATNPSGDITGSLLGVVQTNGSGIKSWMSRRMIVWGGPLIAPREDPSTAAALLHHFKKLASRLAIYVEFRNFFDTSDLQPVFQEAGFAYHPHLNYLVKTDEEGAVRKRMSSSRWRQIKSSRKAGAEIAEAASEQEVLDFYAILSDLYQIKVKKPLAGPEFFLAFWRSGLGKFFLIKREEEVLGGIVCPVFQDKVIYEWYVCGKDGQEKGLHPSVLATWAPIEYGCGTGLEHFDFMGAGKPDDDYGVREFKARFGGEEVAYGRYHLILNKPLYEAGKLGLSLYQKMT